MLVYDLIIVNMLVFPEAYISGYPDWNELYIKLVENAVSDETTDKLCKTFY